MTRKEAQEIVGRAIYGADWIGRLRPREEWLLEQYISYRRKPSGEIVDWSNIAPRELRAKVELAIDRARWLKVQYERVFAWFDDRAFPDTNDNDSPIDTTKFWKDITHDFPDAAKTSIDGAAAEIDSDAVVSDDTAASDLVPLITKAPLAVADQSSHAPIRNARGPDSRKRNEATAAMVKAVRIGTISASALAAMKQKQLNNLYPQAKRTTLVEARVNALKELQQNSDKTPTNDK